MGSGWHVKAEHFAERHGQIILIALGETIIAVGFGAKAHLEVGTLVAAALAVALVSALWWLYFDVAAIFARDRLMQHDGIDRARLARDSYSYLHLVMVIGIVAFAFGLETTLHQLYSALAVVPAAALWGGTALYLLGHVAFLLRTTRHVFRLRTVGAAVLLVLIPAAVAIPAVATLALITAVCWLVVAHEAIRHSEARARLRRG